MSTTQLLAGSEPPTADHAEKDLKRQIFVLRAALGVIAAAGFVGGFSVRGLSIPANDTAAQAPISMLTPQFLEPTPAGPHTLQFLEPIKVSVHDSQGIHNMTLLEPVVVKVSELSDFDSFVPKFFDTRTQWFGCGNFVVDQKQCGDCWAASAANVIGDRTCIHLLEDKQAMPLPQSGAFGAGTYQRKFQQAGVCIADGTTHAAHAHGCKRGFFFPNPQALVSCGNMNNTDAPTFHPYPEDSGYRSGHTLYPSSSGCNGGEAQDAWRFLYHEGMTIMDSTQEGGCTTYTSGACSGTDSNNNGCRPCEFSECADTGEKPERVTVDSFGWIMEEDMPDRGYWDELESFNKMGTDKPRPASRAMERQIKKMQIEMMTNGPLHTCFDDYANFQLFYNQYPQGIYNSTEGSPHIGGHCIELNGWGTDSATGMDYWTWKNSWGVNFGNGGFARILRGVDLVGIESDVWAGCPSNSNCKLTAGVVRNETWVPNHAYFPSSKPMVKHATSASKPSRTWPGGKERLMSKKDYAHSSVAPLVAAAVRHASGDSELRDSAALELVTRVWSRSVRGLRLRVEMKNVDRHVLVTRHMESHLTFH